MTEFATPGTPPISDMRGEITQQWDKITPEEVNSLKSNADLVNQVQSKYALKEEQAQLQVDAFAKGRQL